MIDELSTRNVIYLDNAATTFPKPDCVPQAMTNFIKDIGGSPGRSGHRLARAAQEITWKARESLAKLIGLDKPYRLVFTSGATVALNIALKGYLTPGDHVITTGFEHNSLLRPLKGLSNREDISYSIIRSFPDGTLDLKELEDTLKQKPTKLIAAIQASNVTGSVLPILQISKIAAQYEVALLVDAAQSVGALPVDISNWPRLDFLAFSGHKSLMGPQGTGCLYVSEDAKVVPLYEGGTGSRSESIDHPSHLPDQLESGTANAVGIAGLKESVEFLLSIGVESVNQYEHQLVKQLIDGISQIRGVTIYGGNSCGEHTGVVSFNIDGWDSREVSFILDEEFAIMSRPGLHCAPIAHQTLGTLPNGTVRLSVGYFNTPDEIHLTINAINDIARRRH
jgi:cysteine desulfurase family protein